MQPDYPKDPLPAPEQTILPPGETDADQDHTTDAETAETQADNEEVLRDEVREARALIPVGDRGVAPVNLEQQIDVAKTMAKALQALPQFLHGNVGDCMALIDIASRSNLSPYMLAGHAYSQNNRLCFDAQVYHAMLQSTGYLHGELDIKWTGEGEDMICVIRGRLSSEPETWKELQSEKLRDLHPGHSDKRNKLGRPFVNGSQEWDRKPRKQLAFDTIRDWVRLYAPRATLGIMTRDEMLDWNAHTTEAIAETGLKDRLAQTIRLPDSREPQVEAELARIQPRHDKITPAVASRAVQERRAAKSQAKAAAKPIKRTSARPRAKRPARKAKGTIVSRETPDNSREKRLRHQSKAARSAWKARKRQAAAKAPVPTLPPVTKPAPPARTETLVNPKHLPTAKAVNDIADRAERRARAQAAMDSVTGSQAEREAPYLKPGRDPRAGPLPGIPIKAGEPVHGTIDNGTLTIEPPRAPSVPKTAAEYELYATAWIDKAKDGEEAESRWRIERDERDQLGVSVPARERLANKLNEKFGGDL